MRGVGQRPPVLRLLFTILVLLGSVLPARADTAALERGAAITDPLALRELDRGSTSVPAPRVQSTDHSRAFPRWKDLSTEGSV